MHRYLPELRLRRQPTGLLTDAQARKRGDQTGLDTLVVHAVNDDHWLWGSNLPRLERKR